MSSPSTASKQIVAGGFRHSGSLARAGWVVVARHRRPYFPEGPIPWGTVHVKRIGESWTACGIPTLGWHAFWHVHFPHDVDSRCVECGKALRNPSPRGAEPEARAFAESALHRGTSHRTRISASGSLLMYPRRLRRQDG